MKNKKLFDDRKEKNQMKKKLTTVLAIVLVVALSVAGTYAYLTDKTAQVVNTFTVGNVDIKLAETTGNSYKMVPGTPIHKDPKVTVEADSEACWLFVKVEKSANFDDFMTYDMANGWTKLEEGVFYRQVAASAADQDFAVLTNDTVTVKPDVTKDMMDAIENGTAANPTLTFTAYACQTAGIDTAAKAWAEVGK